MGQLELEPAAIGSPEPRVAPAATPDPPSIPGILEGKWGNWMLMMGRAADAATEESAMEEMVEEEAPS